MGTWDDRLVEAYNRYLVSSARFEGMIEAHRILKGGDGDEADRLLWSMAAEIAREADGE
jgi:hypothetical protein